MTLLLQTVGIIATVVALSAIVEGHVGRWSAAAATVAVVVVAASVLFWGHLWDAAKAFDDASARNRAVPPEAAAVAGGVAVGVNVSFIEWARSQIAERDSYYLMPDDARANQAIYQWLSYQMLPRLSAENPEEADWLIFYDAYPRGTYERADFGPPVHYNRGFAIARRR